MARQYLREKKTLIGARNRLCQICVSMQNRRIKNDMRRKVYDWYFIPPGSLAQQDGSKSLQGRGEEVYICKEEKKASASLMQHGSAAGGMGGRGGGQLAKIQ